MSKISRIFTPRLPTLRESSSLDLQAVSPRVSRLLPPSLEPVDPVARHTQGRLGRLRAYAVLVLTPTRWTSKGLAFDTQLQAWVDKGAPTEKREEAMKRIKHARRYSRSTLNLRGLGLKTLPDCIDKLPKLKTLILNKNHLSELPESVGQLKLLERLELCNNELTRLPESVKNISIVVMDGNPLPDMPDFDSLPMRMATGPGRTRPQALRRVIID